MCVCVEKEALGPCVRACMPCDYDMFVQKFVEERGKKGREGNDVSAFVETDGSSEMGRLVGW